MMGLDLVENYKNERPLMTDLSFFQFLDLPLPSNRRT